MQASLIEYQEGGYDLVGTEFVGQYNPATEFEPFDVQDNTIYIVCQADNQYPLVLPLERKDDDPHLASRFAAGFMQHRSALTIKKVEVYGVYGLIDGDIDHYDYDTSVLRPSYTQDELYQLNKENFVHSVDLSQDINKAMLDAIRDKYGCGLMEAKHAVMTAKLYEQISGIDEQDPVAAIKTIKVALSDIVEQTLMSDTVRQILSAQKKESETQQENALTSLKP